MQSIIDIHCHDGAFKRSSPVYDYVGETMPEFIKDLDNDNIEKCFISSVVALTEDMTKGNQITFSDAGKDKRLFAYIYYNPDKLEQSVKEIQKYSNSSLFIGYKIRPIYHTAMFNGKQYDYLFEQAQQTVKPILVHCADLSEAIMAVEITKRYNIKIVLAHAAMSQYIACAKIIKKSESIFLEPVTSVFYPNKIRDLINIIGTERIMFGSDYGLLTRKRVIKTYEEANLSSNESEKIFRQNAINTYNL